MLAGLPQHGPPSTNNSISAKEEIHEPLRHAVPKSCVDRQQKAEQRMRKASRESRKGSRESPQKDIKATRDPYQDWLLS